MQVMSMFCVIDQTMSHCCEQTIWQLLVVLKLTRFPEWPDFLPWRLLSKYYQLYIAVRVKGIDTVVLLSYQIFIALLFRRMSRKKGKLHSSYAAG